jgi:transcriptional regulator with XRE-family HTH domain
MPSFWRNITGRQPQRSAKYRSALHHFERRNRIIGSYLSLRDGARLTRFWRESPWPAHRHRPQARGFFHSITEEITPMQNPKARTAVDVELGKCIRMERLRAGISQTFLAHQIGVTFQQVQKYEKGTNRVGIGRLNIRDIANALEVPLSTFIGNEDPNIDGPPSAAALLSTPYALRMITAFSAVSRDCQLALVNLLEGMAGDASAKAHEDETS